MGSFSIHTEKPVTRRVLWVAGLAGLLLLGVVVITAGQTAAAVETERQLDTMRRALDIHALGLREAAARYDYLPFTVAHDQEVLAALEHPQDPKQIERTNKFLESINTRAGSSALYLMNMRGNTLAASNWREPITFVGESYWQRPYFTEAKYGKKSYFYAVGRTTRVPGLFIAEPVHSPSGAIVGVLATKVSLDAIQSAWKSVKDPIVLSDRRGIAFLGNVPQWQHKPMRTVTDIEEEWLMFYQPYGAHWNLQSVPLQAQRRADRADYQLSAVLDGKERDYLALDTVIPEFGWTLTVTSDLAVVEQARNVAWVITALVALAIALLWFIWVQRGMRLNQQRAARRELEKRVKERTYDLQQAHAFRKAMEDSLVVGMRARDLEGRILYVNRALCDITGYNVEDLVGRLPPYPYWHPEDMEKHWRDNAQLLSGNPALNGFESRILHHDGREVFTMIYTAKLIDADGQHAGWMSSVVDITEQKRAEERQRMHESQLQHAMRLTILGEMVSTLAHELNQPLMAMANFASAAKAFSQQGRQDLLGSSLDDIKAQARRAADIVQRIRVPARLRTRGQEVCAINTLGHNVLTLLQPEIRARRVTVVTHLDPALPTVTGDQVLLEQVLSNLVMNAMQSMVDTARDRRVVEIRTERQDGAVVLSVADQGSGISTQAMQHLFEPFFTTKPDGLGLGLNVCRTIIENHRGHLSFENRPRGGAIFSLFLPLQA